MLRPLHTFILLFALLGYLPFTVLGQNKQVVLEWNEKASSFISPEGKTITTPTFKDAIHSPKFGYLPFIQTEMSCVSGMSCQTEISNEKYIIVAADSTLKSILDKDYKITSQLVTERKVNKSVSQIVPLRLYNGKVERLVSFDITVKNMATPVSHRAARAYSSNSVLRKGEWMKVAITQTGIYKLDYSFIKTNLGQDPTNTTFSNIGVFGNGGGMVPELNSQARFDDVQENAILRVDRNGNNKMDVDDYILFYGEGADNWSFNQSTSQYIFNKNIYSDNNFYFITTSEATGKSIVLIPSSPAPNQTSNTFWDYTVHELDEYNLLASGREWFGDKMSSSKPSVSFTFDFPNLATSTPINYQSSVLADSPYPSTISLTINGNQIFNHSISGIFQTTYKEGYKPSLKSGSFNSTTEQQAVTYSFSNPDQGSTSLGYIDYITLNAKRALSMVGDAMRFRNHEVVGTGNVTTFTLSNANNNIAIWDVTDPTTAMQQNVTLSGGQLSFSASSSTLREYIALNSAGSFASPVFVSKVSNQDLHALDAQDYIIVTHKDLKTAADRLADFHRTKNGLNVVVVNKELIYNEFGSGKSDNSAIRDFVKMFYDRAGADTTKLPKYLCLFGDGSYDPKDRIKDNNNFVPTYQSYHSQYPLSSYTSDDYFGCLDLNEGGDINSVQRGDIAIGRLPVASLAEANGMVDKIIAYKSPQSLGEWRNMTSSIGDDEDGNLHQDQANRIGEYVRINYPAYNVEKIILDAFKQQKTPGGDRYPDVNTAILNRVNDGALVVSYTGHGGGSNWAHERIFNVSDIQKLKNKYRLPLFVTATCEFARFDDPETKTAGEFLITNNEGGAIGMITTVRAVFSDANDALQNALYRQLFVNINGHKPTLGELMTNTKNAIMAGTDIENTRKFVLLGDPALTLNYPEYNIKTTHINNIPISVSQDTLKALSLVTIKGEVQNWDGSLRTDFDGICYPNVYDKLSTFKTLGNDNGAAVEEFKIYKNSLFRGTTSVVGGKFEYSFIVPVDINYQIGDGRISYYAQTDNNIDAHGYQNDIIIGSSADSFLIDNEGPMVKLYMNNDEFVSGGITDENPSLFAVLEDESGINATGNGIGHDISAIIDEESQNPIILNSFYRTELNNFRKGTVSYPFYKLAEGRHTLHLKAWDVQNNAGEDRTEFVVSTSAKLALMNVLNYPNPVFDKTCFSFEHNRANEHLHIKIDIVNQLGAFVKRIEGDYQSDGFRTACLEWDGSDNLGQQIAKGIYVYRITVSDQTGQSAHQSNKLVLIK
jgi:hypothetical protein